MWHISPLCNAVQIHYTYSWEVWLERSWIWRVLSRKIGNKNGKNEVGKLGPKFYNWELKVEKWKLKSEVGKFEIYLEIINEFGMLLLKLKRSIEVGEKFFPTSFGYSKQKLSNFKLSNFKLSNLKPFPLKNFPT